MKSSFFSNFIWKYIERCGAQVMGVVVSIILARLIAPASYGIIALVMVFVTLAQIFVDSGFGTALVQKKDADDLDFSSVFYFNLFICVCIYALLFFTAPWIEKFYAMPDLTQVVRILSLSIIFSGVSAIQGAYVARNMLFKRMCVVSLFATILSGIAGIYMAYQGQGIWALVYQQLIGQVLTVILLWSVVKWRPLLRFSWQRLSKLFSFGWKLLISALLDRGYNNLRQLLIGKFYTPADLAFYERGNNFPMLIINNLVASIDAVLLPTLSQEQDHRERVRSMARRAIKTSTLLIMPLMMGLAMCGEPLVRLVLTEKWLSSVPYLQTLCFSYSFWTIHTTNLNAINALGRSDIFLKLEIAKKIVGLILIALTLPYGVLALALSTIPSSIICQLINSYPNKYLLQYSYWEQLKDMLPQILLTCFMGIVLWFTGKLPLPDWQMLIMQFVIGASVYTGLAYIFKLESFNYLIALIRGMKKQNDN